MEVQLRWILCGHWGHYGGSNAGNGGSLGVKIRLILVWTFGHYGGSVLGWFSEGHQGIIEDQIGLI